MNERDVEHQVGAATRMFRRYLAWGKDTSMCPFNKQEAPYSYAQWWELESAHTKNQTSQRVVAS